MSNLQAACELANQLDDVEREQLMRHLAGLQTIDPDLLERQVAYAQESYAAYERGTNPTVSLKDWRRAVGLE